MQDRIAHRRLVHVASLLVTGAVLASCSSPGDNPLTVFADPGKYQYATCEQLAGQHKHWSEREQELRLLMDKAEQSTGGALVNLLAYKADHVAAMEELKVIATSVRAKSCDGSASPRVAR